MWTCGGCVVLTILFVVLPMIAISCFGCAACAGAMPMFGSLFQGIANISKISSYFEDLKTQGWEVDDSQSNQPSGFGANVESDIPMIWKARENPDDDWTLYVWTLNMNADAMNNMQNEEEPSLEDLRSLMNFTLTPRTEAALEVHRELGLTLPDDFELEPWDEEGGNGEGGSGRNRDKIDNGDNGDENTDGGDEGASTDNGDEDTDTGNGDEGTDSGDGGTTDQPRHGKEGGSRKAA
jgi:hypothetical protein